MLAFSWQTIVQTTPKKCNHVVVPWYLTHLFKQYAKYFLFQSVNTARFFTIYLIYMHRILKKLLSSEIVKVRNWSATKEFSPGHYSDVIWVSCYLTSLSTWEFVQQFLQANIEKDIKNLSCCMKSTGNWLIPLTNGQWWGKQTQFMMSSWIHTLCLLYNISTLPFQSSHWSLAEYWAPLDLSHIPVSCTGLYTGRGEVLDSWAACKSSWCV